MESPARVHSPSPPPPPPVERIPSLPPPSPVRELPKPEPIPQSLLCRIDLSRIDLSRLNHISSRKKKRSKEVRTRTELSDTRQEKEGKREHRSEKRTKSESKKVKSSSVLPPPQLLAPPVTVPVEHQQRKWQSPTPLTPAEVETTVLPAANLAAKSEKERERERRLSCSSSSSRDSRDRHRHKRRKLEARHVRSDPVPPPSLPPTNHEREAAPPPTRMYFSCFERYEAEALNISDTDKDQYLLEAKRLKHMANRETDHTAQCMLFLESVLYFILTGNAMEQERGANEKAVYTMYRDSLNLIRQMTSNFHSYQKNTQNQGNIQYNLVVLSLRCQSLLYLKLFKMCRQEVKEYQKVLTEFLQQKPNPATLEHCPSIMAGQGTPSPLSPTPSPAGSVGSVGSQSSGYSSGELRGGQIVGQVPPQQPPLTHCVAVPLSIYRDMQKQNQHFAGLLTCHDLWEQADMMVYSKHKDFFIELDRTCGPLTLHSSLIHLVYYVRMGIKRLKEL